MLSLQSWQTWIQRAEYKMSESTFDEFAFTEVMAVYLDNEGGANLGQNYARKRPAFHRSDGVFGRKFAAEYASRLAASGAATDTKMWK